MIKGEIIEGLIALIFICVVLDMVVHIVTGVCLILILGGLAAMLTITKPWE